MPPVFRRDDWNPARCAKKHRWRTIDCSLLPTLVASVIRSLPSIPLFFGSPIPALDRLLIPRRLINVTTSLTNLHPCVSVREHGEFDARILLVLSILAPETARLNTQPPEVLSFVQQPTLIHIVPSYQDARPIILWPVSCI
jgi:hypothetical protein